MSSISLVEPTLVTYIALLGVLSIRLANSSASQILRQFALALPLGCCYIVSASIISFAVFSRWVPWFVLGAPLVPCLWTFRKFSSGQVRQTGLQGGLVLIAYFVLSALLRHLNIAIFSYDSYQFVFLGIGFSHSVHLSHFADYFLSYASFIVSIQALARFFGEDYASSVSPLFIICAMSYTLFCALIRLRGGKPLTYLAAAVVITVAVSCVFSPYFVLQQIFYVNNHRFHGCMMFLAVMEICSFANTQGTNIEERTNYSLIIFTLLGGVIFSRIEGPLTAALLLILLAETKKLSGKQFVLGALPLIAFYILWTLVLWRYRNLSGRVAPAGSFITPLRMLEIMVPALLVCGAYSIKYFRRSIFAWRYFTILILLGVLIGHAITNPQPYAETVTNSLQNLLIVVPWGIIWPIAALAVCYTLAKSRDPRESSTCFVLIAYPLMLLALSAFRTPYRLSWGDSGNRMMGHLIPFVAYIVIFKALEVLSVNQQQLPTASPSQAAIPNEA